MFELIAEPDMTPEKTAENVLLRFGITHAPVNPIAIARRLGFDVRASVFRDQSTIGRVAVRDGSVRIDVNAADPPTRRNYTIAHEIGHALLHLRDVEAGELVDSKEMFRVTGASRPKKEVEADRFAAALLMPASLVEQQYVRDQNEASLARFFSVSPQAMHIRMEHLGLRPR
jgi:IrrE N-terminal-like domain